MNRDIASSSRSARQGTGRRLWIAALVALPLALVGCSGAPGEPLTADPGSSGSTAPVKEVEPAELLAPLGLDGLDAREVIDRLDALPVAERPGDLIASVQPDRLLLSDTASGAEASLPLPDDLFYVSIAPYVEQTHDCFFHSLTTCLGELQNAEIELTATDRDTGEVLASGARTTADNGFAGLWLPRGTEVDLEVAHGELRAETTISTGSVDDPTCLTTLRLASA